MFEWILLSVISLIMIVSFWIIFLKAGRPGWYAVIPLWNVVAMLDVAGKNPWLAVFIVVVSRIFSVLIPEISLGHEIVADLAFLSVMTSVGFIEKFSCSTLFSIGMILFPVIFYPIIAFGRFYYDEEEYGYYDEDK